MFLSDFHIHSRWSDGILSIPEIVDLFGAQGFGAIAITDHVCSTGGIFGKGARFLKRTLHKDNFSAYMEEIQNEAQRAMRQYGMLVVPGIELTQNEISELNSSHILALGVQQFIDPDLEVRSLLKEIRSQGALSVAAHPVHTMKTERQTYHLWNHRHELEEEIDVWEVASGPDLFDEVAETNLRKIASSDLHGPRQMRSWKTLLHCEKKTEAVLEAIQKQKVDFQFFEPEPMYLSLDGFYKKTARRKISDNIFDLSLALF